MGTPNLACRLVFTKVFQKIGFELMLSLLRRHGHVFENDVIFKITSQAVQIFHIVLFLVLNHQNIQSS